MVDGLVWYVPERHTPSAGHRMTDSSSKPVFPVGPHDATAIPTRRGSAKVVPRWLRQTELMIAVLVRLYLGLALCFVPWFRPLWDNNPLFLHVPSLLPLLTSGAVRGVVSGLGLLNLWLALDGAIRSSKEWEQ